MRGVARYPGPSIWNLTTAEQAGVARCDLGAIRFAVGAPSARLAKSSIAVIGDASHHLGTARAWIFETRLRMAKLTESKKKAEPSKEFGLPEQRKYPMPDASHARNAKARASQMEHQGKLSASDKKKIDAKANEVMGK
jgi:hypothetical protein